MSGNRRTDSTKATKAPARGDAFLREHGFQIYSRPADGVPLWKRGEVVVTEPKAYQLASRAAEVKENLDTSAPGD